MQRERIFYRCLPWEDIALLSCESPPIHFSGGVDFKKKNHRRSSQEKPAAGRHPVLILGIPEDVRWQVGNDLVANKVYETSSN